MFYLIGLGLDLESISAEAVEALGKCKKVYLDAYTVEFPYDVEKLAGVLGKKVIPLTRIMVEQEEFIDEAKKQDVALLVYGSPLTATTHISLILKCKKENIPYHVFNNASIFEAVAETGLQIYKFGKTASMPAWKEGYKPDSFKKVILDNLKINAHTLILADIGLNFSEALKQLKQALKGMKLEKVVVCSRLGTKESQVYYNNLDKLSAEIYAPFCFIIPGKLHFIEEEALSLIS